MRYSIFLLIVVILGCTGKRVTKDDVVSTTSSIDTLVLKSYLNSPINFDSLNSVEKECTPLGTYGTAFMRDRYKCFYALDEDTLATIIFTVFKTDSTWTFGTNGYEIEKFQCRDKRMPFQLGLGIGTDLTEFERQLGQFEEKDPGIYSKAFRFEDEEIELKLETDNGRVTGVLITAANKVHMPLPRAT